MNAANSKRGMKSFKQPKLIEQKYMSSFDEPLIKKETFNWQYLRNIHMIERAHAGLRELRVER